MNIDGKAWRTIWLEAGGRSIGVIDQTQLPHTFTTRSLTSLDQAAEAISTMVVRGAPLIGVTGAYGLMLALQADPSDGSLAAAFTLEEVEGQLREAGLTDLTARELGDRYLEVAGRLA